jgi:hypothetical protein
LIGSLAGVIILVAAVVIAVSNRSAGTNGRVGLAVTTSTVTATTQTSDLTVTTATQVVTPTTVIPTTTVAATGHLIVQGGAKPVNLGTSASSVSVMIGNDGKAPLDFAVTAAGEGLSVGPVSGTLPPSGVQTLTVAFDRSSSSPGPFTGSIQISSGGGSATVDIVALVDPGPTIVGETSSTLTVYTGGCKTTHPIPTAATVSAEVSGSQSLSVVVLHWQSAIPADNGSLAMTAFGSTYSGQLGPFTLAGAVDWWVTAIDSANVSSTSAHHLLTVAC